MKNIRLLQQFQLSNVNRIANKGYIINKGDSLNMENHPFTIIGTISVLTPPVTPRFASAYGKGVDR